MGPPKPHLLIEKIFGFTANGFYCKWVNQQFIVDSFLTIFLHLSIVFAPVSEPAGMIARQWAAVKRNGEQEAAAKAWAACKLNATLPDSDCDDFADATFQKVSGSTEKAAWDAVKANVAKLGKAKMSSHF